MLPHLKPEFSPTGSRGSFVGLLDARELRGGAYVRHLSVDERAKFTVLPSETRKDEWLAGRLAAKYIFLSGLERSQTPEPSQATAHHWKPTLSELSPEMLGVYSPWMYRKVEVVTNDGRPSLVWCGQARSESISLSHSGSVSCASMSFGEPTAIDIETPLPRLDAFYRVNFSEAERRWAMRSAGGELTKTNWFFTLLWTLKESVLKLGWLNQSSIWNLPRIEIGDLPGLKNIGPSWYSNTMSNEFSIFTVRVKEHCRVMQVKVAITGTRNFILTVVNPLGGVVK